MCAGSAAAKRMKADCATSSGSGGAAKPLPVNPIQVGELLPALAVGRRCGFEQMDQALGERVGHDNPAWKIMA